MEIIVMGIQNKVDYKLYLDKYLPNKFGDTSTLIKEFGNAFVVTDESGDAFVFPEHRAKFMHPIDLLNYMRRITTEHIENNKPLFCLTLSDHVLNGIRLAIKQHEGDVNAKTIQILNNGEIVEAPILGTGQLTEWVDGIWDTWDVALMELL